MSVFNLSHWTSSVGAALNTDKQHDDRWDHRPPDPLTRCYWYSNLWTWVGLCVCVSAVLPSCRSVWELHWRGRDCRGSRGLGSWRRDIQRMERAGRVLHPAVSSVLRTKFNIRITQTLTLSGFTHTDQLAHHGENYSVSENSLWVSCGSGQHHHGYFQSSSWLGTETMWHSTCMINWARAVWKMNTLNRQRKCAQLHYGSFEPIQGPKSEDT